MTSLLKTMHMRARFPSVLPSREKQGERWGKEQPTEQLWNPHSSPSDLVNHKELSRNWNQGSPTHQMAYPMRCLSTMAVQQCANSCRSSTTAGNKGCFHRYGEKQLWSSFWRKGKSQTTQTAIDHKLDQLHGEDHEQNCKWAPEVVSGNGGPPCTRTGRILTVLKHRRSSHLSASRNLGRLSRTEVGTGILDWPPESVR